MLDLSRFSGPPRVEPYVKNGVEQRGDFRVLEYAWYDDPVLGRQWLLKDFVMNFGSTPQLLRALPAYDPLQHGRFIAPYHDQGYCFGARPREVEDAMLKRGLAACEPWWIQWSWHKGVRAGGWAPWRRYRKRGEGPQAEDFATLEGYARGWDYYQAVKAGRTWSP